MLRLGSHDRMVVKQLLCGAEPVDMQDLCCRMPGFALVIGAEVSEDVRP